MSQYLAEHGWLTWILIGLVAGAIAKAITPGRDPGGCIVTIVVGIAGAVLAGFLGQQLGWYDPGEGAGFLAAIVGAVLILFVYRMVARR
ncbi:MAG TPA: GlsB/YeaQ/YmgE family stress response membrane protein [Allosphingosinicella sp.]|nr:GlsB/YeaQ/YmgE family stress response membrane protein [Allosphingosinicella sp.]